MLTSLTLGALSLVALPAWRPLPQSPIGPPVLHDVVLETREGQSLEGWLLPAADGRFGLGSHEFAETLTIRPEALASIEFAEPEREESDSELEEPGSAGLYRFELVGGELLQGRLLEVSPERWSIDAVGFGALELPLEQLVHADSLGSSTLLFNGPGGLGGWRQRFKKKSWFAAPNKLYAGSPRARLERGFELDEERRVRLELSWSGEPRFRVSLGSKRRGTVESGVCLEVWGDSLVAWSEVGDQLDVLELERGLAADGGVVVHARTAAEEVLFLDEDGGELGSVRRPKRSGSYLSLLNDGERLELRSLRILAVSEGVFPTRLDAARITGFDAEGGSFETAEGLLSADEVLGVDFEQRESEPASEAAPPGSLWLDYADGRRIAGDLLRISEQGLELQPRWRAEAVLCPLDGLARIEVVEDPAAGRRSRTSRSFLVVDDGAIAGELDSIGPAGEIVWRPTIAEGAATLDAESVERVVINRKTAYYVSGRKYPHYLRLRSGDAFRCKLLSMDDAELRFLSPFGGEHELALERVKAIEFDVRAMQRFRKLFEKESKPQQSYWADPRKVRRETSQGFDAASLERAMALPRKYKRRRFKHLILARTGDFLRTEVTSWSPEGVRYRGALDEQRLIPSERLAAVIWLSEDASEEPRAERRVARVVLDERTQLNLELSGTRDGELLGTSSVLGELALDLNDVLSIELDDELLVKPGPYADWVLEPMKEPFPDEEDGAEGDAVRVGVAAPETSGADLRGVDLALVDYRGKVVLLDFWGHW